ncbi:DUF7288 family protein [Halostella pelagica]|uniref:DUF7288 family protein n=1 Tax=Halostella pelagica TaxID=2583824 RepID=UPI001080611C|nr:hypothetical protein [Halostella pelagica]
MRDDRGQAFTLEGFIGSMLILTAVLFALQSVIITPTTAGTVDRDVQAQHQSEANDILQQAKNNESLKYLVLNLNPSRGNEVYNGTSRSDIGYGASPPPTEFGQTLNATFNQRGKVYNIIVEYRDVETSVNSTNVTVRSKNMVYRGVPSDTAVVATETVTVYDDDPMPNSARTVAEAAEAGEFPVSDTAPNSPVFTVVEVYLIVW